MIDRVADEPAGTTHAPAQTPSSAWRQVTLARGQTVAGLLRELGVPARPDILLAVAQRNDIRDFRRIPEGTELWLPSEEAAAVRPSDVQPRHRRAVEQDLRASGRSAAARRAVRAPEGARPSLAPAAPARSGVRSAAPAPAPEPPRPADVLLDTVASARARVSGYERALAAARAPSPDDGNTFALEGFVPRQERPAFDAQRTRLTAERELRELQQQALSRLTDAGPAYRAQLGVELRRAIADLHVLDGNARGVVAAYEGSPILTRAVRDVIAGQATDRAELGKPKASVAPAQALASLAAGQRVAAAEELLHLGRQLTDVGSSEARAMAERAQLVLDRVLADANDPALSARGAMLRARRALADRDLERGVVELDRLRLNAPSSLTATVTLELASALSTASVAAASSGERQRFATRLNALRRDLEAGTVLDDQQRARVLVLEANAMLAANRGAEAKAALDRLEQPPYAAVPWVAGTRASMLQAAQHGGTAAALKVVLAELHGESLGEALTALGGGAAIGAATGALLTRTPQGAAAGALLGASVATVVLKLENLRQASDRVLQAHQSGLSTISASRTAVDVGLTALPFVPAGLAARLLTGPVARRVEQRAALPAPQPSASPVAAAAAPRIPPDDTLQKLWDDVIGSQSMERLRPFVSSKDDMLMIDVRGLRQLRNADPNAASAIARLLESERDQFLARAHALRGGSSGAPEVAELERWLRWTFDNTRVQLGGSF